MGVSFHAVVFFGLGKKLLLKSVLGHCEVDKLFDLNFDLLVNFEIVKIRSKIDGYLAQQNLNSKFTYQSLTFFQSNNCKFPGWTLRINTDKLERKSS